MLDKNQLRLYSAGSQNRKNPKKSKMWTKFAKSEEEEKRKIQI